MNNIDYNRFIERGDIIDKLKYELDFFENNKNNLLIKRNIYFYGNHGIGKTTLILNLLKCLDYEIIKIHSNDIKYQIQNLNKLVLDYAINQVYSETVGYIKYKYDISTMYDPISRPVLSRTNDKQLELKKWF